MEEQDRAYAESLAADQAKEEVKVRTVIIIIVTPSSKNNYCDLF